MMEVAQHELLHPHSEAGFPARTPRVGTGCITAHRLGLLLCSSSERRAILFGELFTNIPHVAKDTVQNDGDSFVDELVAAQSTC